MGKQNKQQQSDFQGMLPPGWGMCVWKSTPGILLPAGRVSAWNWGEGAGIAAGWEEDSLSSSVSSWVSPGQGRSCCVLVHSRAFASLCQEDMRLDVGTGAVTVMVQPQKLLPYLREALNSPLSILLKEEDAIPLFFPGLTAKAMSSFPGCLLCVSYEHFPLVTKLWLLRMGWGCNGLLFVGRELCDGYLCHLYPPNSSEKSFFQELLQCCSGIKLLKEGVSSQPDSAGSPLQMGTTSGARRAAASLVQSTRNTWSPWEETGRNRAEGIFSVPGLWISDVEWGLGDSFPQSVLFSWVVFTVHRAARRLWVSSITPVPVFQGAARGSWAGMSSHGRAVTVAEVPVNFQL